MRTFNEQREYIKQLESKKAVTPYEKGRKAKDVVREALILSIAMDMDKPKLTEREKLEAAHFEWVRKYAG